MNYVPSPQYGSGTYGAVPGVITAPNPAEDLAAQYPDLFGTNSLISGNIRSGLQGNISQPDLNYMQDQAAGAAAASGMPGSNVRAGTLMGNRSARDIGKLQYQIQQDAIDNYNRTIPTISSTQTLSPQAQLEVAGTNATNAAAPNPAAAQSYAQQLYDRYKASASGGGGNRIGDISPSHAVNVPSLSPDWATSRWSGGTGTSGNSMYPGYTWDPRTGQYVAQAQNPAQGNMTDGSGAWTIGGNATQYPGSTYVQSGADFEDLFGGQSDPEMDAFLADYGYNPDGSEMP